MPGFILHLAEAKQIARLLGKESDTNWCQEFFLGSLLPDTKLGPEKFSSHFWDPAHLNHIARAPKLKKFLDKYGHRINEPVILGYYAHLFLDEKYVDQFWTDQFRFEDKNGQIEWRKDRIVQVELLHDHKQIPFDAFFTSEYYYGDYTRSNHWFVERYQIIPPEYKEIEVDMTEVDPQKLECALEELHYLCASGKLGDEKELKVFELNRLDAFIMETSRTFCRHIEELCFIR